ncbi:MAG TPA: hypothetical protein VH087_12250 [Thermoanaerobaculia bacterium]|nr:hypothetical protein [Thermoanaerobaculia bacterium]
MSGRRLGLLGGLALIVAQICCAPPVVARPMQCPIKAHGTCPMERQNTCRATAPQHSTAVKPKPVAAITVQGATRQIALLARIYVLAVVTPALQHVPLDLVLRI